MKNGRKIKRSMWVAMAACAMIFLCIGGCLVYGLHAAEDYIDANCRRDLGALMEQLERPYITRLNTSAFLARAMERYLFSEGERTVDLQGEARFLSALDGQSVLDILFVTQDGQYISLSGKTGQQTIDTATRRKLAEGKMVSGYRMWNGEEAFFVVESLRPFAVHDVYYDAIALAYTPGTINGVLSFYAYGGQANICVVDRMGHVVYAADHVWNRLDMLSRYDGPEKKQASADMDERCAGCVTLKTTAGESVYLAYRPIEDTPYMVVCEAACSLVQNVLRDYSALIARIVAAALAMLGLLAALLNVGIIRMADAMRKEAHAREKQLAQEKANCELASVNSTLRESICRAEMLREQMQREQEEKKRLYRSISRGIRTPLNVVVGLARLLTRTDDIETMKRYAGQMNGQIERVMAVLSDEKKPVDLGAYVSAQPRSTERRLTGLRVLLAEDSEMNAEIMIRLLTDAGAECDRAADGMQALRRFEAVEAGTYDVVLMDMQMPVMDGCEAARAIRRCGRAGAADIPIIAMTANAFEDVRERIFDAGMDGYLGKPVEPDKLACAVIAAVKTRKGD